MNGYKDEEQIKSKINEIEKRINDDLSLIPEYKLLTVYNKISKIIKNDDRKYLILRNKFIFIDKTLTGYINLQDFYNILNNNLPLEKDELKILLCDPVLRNKINPNLYQYKPFFDLIRRFKETDLLKMKQEYNQEQNPYIIKLKDEIKTKKANIKNLWEKIFTNGLKCRKDNFNLLFVELKPNYNFHKLEIEYIFNIICKIGEDNIEFETFRNIIKKESFEDIRVFYFKGLKEFRKKEKDKKEENENLLINYYPNVLETNNINAENVEENTKYLVIKEENIINKNETNNIKSNNNNEHFILGNTQINPDDNLQNLNNINNIPKKDVKSVLAKLEISESLVIKAKQKNIEDESINKTDNINEAQNKILYKKYYQKVYDIQGDISKKKFNKNNEDILNEPTVIIQKKEIDKKIELSNNKVNNLLTKHEEFKVLNLYSSLKNQFNLLNEEILQKIINEDAKKTKYLSLNDIISTLQRDLKINFVKEDLSLLLNTLQNRDNKNGLFSFEEFINSINNVSDEYTKKAEAIKNLALINFNTYLVELKQYIIEKNINIDEIFNAFSTDKINLTLNEFIFLLKSLNYNLDNFEYNYIFKIISRHSEKKLLSKKDLVFFINSVLISEDEFIKVGKIEKNLQDILKQFWYKFIPRYDIKKSKILVLNNYEQIFKQISNQKIKFGINNLADLFCSFYEVDLDGIIKKREFIKAMNILEINDSKHINDLLIFFEDSYDKNGFKLFYFLGLFASFEQDKKKLDEPPTNFKIYPKSPNIIFKNNYGFFTQLDLAKIKVLCLTICETILFIKRQRINDYLMKFDLFQKCFFTLEQLKAILIDDLNLKKYDLINIFLSYVLENEKQNDYYIIKIKKLVEVINQFFEDKNDNTKLDLKTTFNYTNEIFNKLLNSTIMDIRLNKKEKTNFYFSPNAGIY